MGNTKGAIQDKIYTPFNGFDGPEHKLKLKPTSKIYVREVCDVQAKRIVLNDNIRCQYADQAGYKRQGYETMASGKRRPVFEIFDIYDEYHVHAAMAMVMFYQCPKLIEVNEVAREIEKEVENEDGKKVLETHTETDYEITIVNEDLFNALDEGVVNAAFLAFSSARNGTQSTLPTS